MTADPDLAEREAARRAEHLVQAAVAAERRATDRLRLRMADLRADEATRLDDRIRALLHHHLVGIVEALERQLRQEAERLLVTRGERVDIARLREAEPQAVDRLAGSDLLADTALVGELLARLRHDLIAERLPAGAVGENEPSLLVRLADVSDHEVSRAARGLLVAESRRREALALGAVEASDLPAELYQRLVWLVAATMRVPGHPALDRVLAEAAGRILAGHDEGERAEASAMRLALAIDARPHEIAALIDEALGDRRLSLVVAVLAHASQFTFEQVRSLAVEPDDERWWLLLRAIDLDPLAIARLGLALSEADPRRHGEDLPSLLDAVNTIPASDARAALASLRLPADFRAAVQMLDEGAAA